MRWWGVCGVFALLTFQVLRYGMWMEPHKHTKCSSIQHTKHTQSSESKTKVYTYICTYRVCAAMLRQQLLAPGTWCETARISSEPKSPTRCENGRNDSETQHIIRSAQRLACYSHCCGGGARLQHVKYKNEEKKKEEETSQKPKALELNLTLMRKRSCVSRGDDACWNSGSMQSLTLTTSTVMGCAVWGGGKTKEGIGRRYNNLF